MGTGNGVGGSNPLPPPIPVDVEAEVDCAAVVLMPGPVLVGEVVALVVPDPPAPPGPVSSSPHAAARARGAMARRREVWWVDMALNR
jgi:hypothetical protein